MDRCHSTAAPNRATRDKAKNASDQLLGCSSTRPRPSAGGNEPAAAARRRRGAGGAPAAGARTWTAARPPASAAAGAAAASRTRLPSSWKGEGLGFWRWGTGPERGVECDEEEDDERGRGRTGR